MTSRSPLNRRSFIARIVGGTLVAGGAVALIRGPAWAEPGQRCVGDTDPNDRVSCHDRTDTDAADLGGGWSDDDPTDRHGRGRGPVAIQGQTQGAGHGATIREPQGVAHGAHQTTSTNTGQASPTTTRSTGH